ncbi:MAG: Cof-type HAD-IIB family hydrolase [Firmicutes bacterium]|nr:Cof-type HAD-IIB family hydrolase [Bacillota bacterium]
MIKLIALDLDGTVLGPDMKPVECARQAIRRALSNGVRVVLATGRSFWSGAAHASDLGLAPGPLIAYNGALVREFPDGPDLRELPVPLDDARVVIELCRTNGIYLQIYQDDRCYASMDCEWVTRHTRITGRVPSGIGDLASFLKKAPPKLCVMGDARELELASRLVREALGDRLSVTRSLPFVVEFLHPQASKGKALEFVAAALGIRREEVMACGDSANDLDMIEWAGVGVAMGSAGEEVKAVADWVAPGGCGEGVASAIERFVLNEHEG